MDRKLVYRSLTILIIASTVVRLLLAAFLEFGNDEVYYWTYALYPDLSHFDHPPIVGWVIQIFSLNLLFQDELFIRLGAVIFSSINIYLVFLIGKLIRNERSGFFASLLYTASIYGFIISGTFILPDSPQMFFWFLAVFFMLKYIRSGSAPKWIILFGLASGLAMISKHTSIFLWAGMGLYILLYKRRLMTKPSLYLSAILSFSFLLPVLIWNINYDWISFTYQGERVNFFGSGLRPDDFFTELSGQIAYNNPINFVIIILSLIALGRKKSFISAKDKYALLLTGLPIIIIFLLFSLFRSTLPHWSAPGYATLSLIAAAYLDYKVKEAKLLPGGIFASLSLLVIVLILGVAQINNGLLIRDDNKDPLKLGKKDFSLDMYGWDQLKDKFEHQILDNEEYSSSRNDDLISYRWFPAANLDYYVAYPLGMNLKAIGNLDRIHKYAWINIERGGFKPGDNAWFITFSNDYYNPVELYSEYYSDIYPVDTIDITRNGRIVKKAFVYRLEEMTVVPDAQINY